MWIFLFCKNLFYFHTTFGQCCYSKKLVLHWGLLINLINLFINSLVVYFWNRFSNNWNVKEFKFMIFLIVLWQLTLNRRKRKLAKHWKHGCLLPWFRVIKSYVIQMELDVESENIPGAKWKVMIFVGCRFYWILMLNFHSDCCQLIILIIATLVHWNDS